MRVAQLHVHLLLATAAAAAVTGIDPPAALEQEDENHDLDYETGQRRVRRRERRRKLVQRERKHHQYNEYADGDSGYDAPYTYRHSPQYSQYNKQYQHYQKKMYYYENHHARSSKSSSSSKHTKSSKRSKGSPPYPPYPPYHPPRPRPRPHPSPTPVPPSPSPLPFRANLDTCGLTVQSFSFERDTTVALELGNPENTNARGRLINDNGYPVIRTAFWFRGLNPPSALLEITENVVGCSNNAKGGASPKGQFEQVFEKCVNYCKDEDNGFPCGIGIDTACASNNDLSLGTNVVFPGTTQCFCIDPDVPDCQISADPFIPFSDTFECGGSISADGKVRILNGVIFQMFLFDTMSIVVNGRARIGNLVCQEASWLPEPCDNSRNNIATSR